MLINDCENGDWQRVIRLLVNKQWGERRQVILLTDLPAKLKDDGVDVSAMLAGKRLLKFLQSDANKIVAVIQHSSKPGVWGIAPLEESDNLCDIAFPAFNASVEDLSISVAKPSKSVAKLSKDAPWYLNADGILVPASVNTRPLGGQDSQDLVLEQKVIDQELKSKTYATIRHPTIAAVINRKFYFIDREKAEHRISLLHKFFVFAKPDIGESEEDRLIWIRGFDISAEEEGLGYKGNYARISIEKLPGSGFTIVATRVYRPISRHPQKKNVAAKHANWGHPFMRRIKRGGQHALCSTMEEAQECLDRFHREFPESTIPGKLQLFAHIYVKEGGDIGGGHIQKIVIAAQPNMDGNYVLFWRPNYRGIQVAIESGSLEKVSLKLPDLKPNVEIISDIIDELFGDDAE